MAPSSSVSSSPEHLRGWQPSSSFHPLHAYDNGVPANQASHAHGTPSSSSGLPSIESGSSAGSARQQFAAGSSTIDTSSDSGPQLAHPAFSHTLTAQKMQIGSAPVSSPLFDCVNPPTGGTPMSNRSSEAGSSYFRAPSSQRPSITAVYDKQLPSLPPPEEDFATEDARFGFGEDTTRQQGLDSMNAFISADPYSQYSDSPNFAGRSNTSLPPRSPKQSTTPSLDAHSNSGFLNRISPSWTPGKGSRDKPSKQRPRFQAGQYSAGGVATDDPNLIGLGVQSDAPSSEKDASQIWSHRAAAMKAASQTAGAGIKKWGKASAAKLKQAQQLSRENSPLISGWGRPVGGGGGVVGGGLKRYDGRSAKSATDLPVTSSDVDGLAPPMPSLPTAMPDPHIGLPTDVRHNVHVDVGPQGYTGLPMSWAQVLAQYGMDADEVRRNPEGALEVIRERTQYFVDKEAELGQDPEHTKKVLESRLGNLEDMQEAREAVRSATPGLVHRQSSDNATRSDATTRRASVASTTHSSVLNQGWPASPTWSDAPSLPKVPNRHISPSLPSVDQDDAEEDWGASLLRALPASSSNDSGLRKTESIHGDGASRFVPPASAADSSPQDHSRSRNDDAEASEELHDHEEEMADDFETASIQTASKISAIKVSRGSFGMSSSDSDMALALRMMDRRESDSSGISASNSTSSLARYMNVSDTQRSSIPPGSISSSVADTGSSSRLSNSVTIPSPSLTTASNSLAANQGSQRPASSSSNTTVGSELSSQVSHGLRERRKQTPRVYPPSSTKFIPKEDAPSPRSIGFKQTAPATSTGSAPSNARLFGQRISNGSASSPTSDTAYRHERSHRDSPLLDPGSAHAGTTDSSLHATGRNSGASVQLASTPLQTFVKLGSRQSGTSDYQSSLNPSHASQTSQGHITPEIIRPDSDGFFRPSSAVSSKGGFHSPIQDRTSSSESPLRTTISDQGDGERSPSPFRRASAVRESHLENEGAEHVAHSGDGQEDYQPASDFLDDWMNDDEADEEESIADEDAEDESEARSYSDTAVKESGDVQHVHRSDILADLGAFRPTLAAQQQHQSPSPALLLGLPTPLRTQFDTAITLTPPQPPPTRSTPGIVNQEGSIGTKGEDGWSLQPMPNAHKLSSRSERDWRARSLPPPPPEEEFVDDVEKRQDLSVKEDDRASIISLPNQDAEAEGGRGPPLADEEALEAAAMTRPSSRASRSSSRAGSRSLRRRSSDARRFPMSMHFANGFDVDTLNSDPEATLSFAELMRARQSINLDDVMPMHLGSTSAGIPPVPSLPSFDQSRTATEKATSSESPAHIKSELSAFEERIPPMLGHLRAFLRSENPQSVFGDLVLIGEGESGNVFSAIPALSCRVNSISGRGKVAIKVVCLPDASEVSSKDEQSGKVRLHALDKELSLWREGGTHENFVALYDVFFNLDESQGPSGVWIAQEFMSMSLADVIALRADGLAFEEQHMARIMHDICVALEHLHEKQVIHRDVRSDNCLLTFDGKAKLADFTHAASIKVTKRSSVIGTAYWMAPEVIQAETYGTYADIWSLGVILFEMAEGSPPRVEFPALRAITLTTQLGMPPLSEPERWSSSLKACLAWCTDMKPEQRPTANMVIQSEFIASAGSHKDVCDLIESARMLEAETMSQTEEEVINDTAEEGHYGELSATNLLSSPYENQNVRDSWTSQSTVHA